ncbi:menaquinone biosynthetic enzyme MqnA/MqnD family protein [Desulfatiglans anilini]|uniref:menaquinone biosynthetic enzyme MqnA/MqnD family protein n=1 Tax=Desulfatiglans anilini TaxID=90728 RepID=UPI0003FDDCF1|nr:menaquinone biosynthesis protein [Desulfatiglans anilini]
MTERVEARIGMVNFINTAPIYDVWQRTVHRPEWLITEAAPATLNRLLSGGQLDVAFVSSHEYAVRPEFYKVLPGLSISSTGPVGSVFLFADVLPGELDGRLVYLSSKSQTSAALVKVILEEFHGVHPRYRTGDILDLRGEREPVAGVMAIGDEALQLAEGGTSGVRIDLGEEWYRRTGLPFVFALWVVRESFSAEHPECVSEIRSELMRCAAKGREELEEISRRVAPRIPMSSAACRRYLQKIEYDLEEEKRRALDLFFHYLIERGEGRPEALPVKYFEVD